MIVGLIAAVVLAADWMSKAFFLSILREGRSVPVLPGIFHLTLVFNRGIAFGLFKDAGPWLLLIAAVVLVLLFAWGKDRLFTGRPGRVALALILGGAIGNAIDRIRFGCVVDFFDFRIWPVFNIADSCITIGAVMLVILLIRNQKT